MKHPCPICGDPNGYPFWFGDEPPRGCPNDPSGTVRNVTECEMQMSRAKRAAQMRKLTPDAFDANGTMIPEHSDRAWTTWIEAGRNGLLTP